MDLGWGTAIQAVILAVCTWYMRRGARSDRDLVVKSTAAQSTSNDILQRVQNLELDLAIVKKATLRESGLDDRAPGRQA